MKCFPIPLMSSVHKPVRGVDLQHAHLCVFHTSELGREVNESWGGCHGDGCGGGRGRGRGRVRQDDLW